MQGGQAGWGRTAAAGRGQEVTKDEPAGQLPQRQLFEGDTNDQGMAADTAGHRAQGWSRNHSLGSAGSAEAQGHTAKLSWGRDPGLWSHTAL